MEHPAAELSQLLSCLRASLQLRTQRWDSRAVAIVMGKGKKKVGGAAGSRGVGETKALRNAVEAAVNEAVAIQVS